MTLRAWARLLPPFVLGAVLAVAGAVASGLLLFQGPGFIPALSVIVALLLASLGFGVFAGARGGRHPSVAVLRRRWLSALLWVAAAAGFAAIWEAFQGLGGGAVAQGVGLSVLGALPYYSLGTLLGGMARQGEGAVVSTPGPPAAFGAATGSLLVGLVLFPIFSPSALLILCVPWLLGAGWVDVLLVGARVPVTSEPAPGDRGGAFSPPPGGN